VRALGVAGLRRIARRCGAFLENCWLIRLTTVASLALLWLDWASSQLLNLAEAGMLLCHGNCYLSAGANKTRQHQFDLLAGGRITLPLRAAILGAAVDEQADGTSMQGFGRDFTPPGLGFSLQFPASAFCTEGLENTYYRSDFARQAGCCFR